MIRQNRSIIQQMDKEATVDIETKIKIIMWYWWTFWWCKTSGAGGGDCGITIIDNRVDKHSIYEVWEKRELNLWNLKYITDNKTTIMMMRDILLRKYMSCFLFIANLFSAWILIKKSKIIRVVINEWKSIWGNNVKVGSEVKNNFWFVTNVSAVNLKSLKKN